MSLFDFVDETTKRSYETVYPDVGEYEKSDLFGARKRGARHLRQRSSARGAGGVLAEEHFRGNDRLPAG